MDNYQLPGHIITHILVYEDLDVSEYDLYVFSMYDFMTEYAIYNLN